MDPKVIERNDALRFLLKRLRVNSFNAITPDIFASEDHLKILVSLVAIYYDFLEEPGLSNEVLELNDGVNARLCEAYFEQPKSVLKVVEGSLKILEGEGIRPENINFASKLLDSVKLSPKANSPQEEAALNIFDFLCGFVEFYKQFFPLQTTRKFAFSRRAVRVKTEFNHVSSCDEGGPAVEVHENDLALSIESAQPEPLDILKLADSYRGDCDRQTFLAKLGLSHKSSVCPSPSHSSEVFKNTQRVFQESPRPIQKAAAKKLPKPRNLAKIRPGLSAKPPRNFSRGLSSASQPRTPSTSFCRATPEQKELFGTDEYGSPVRPSKTNPSLAEKKGVSSGLKKPQVSVSSAIKKQNISASKKREEFASSALRKYDRSVSPIFRKQENPSSPGLKNREASVSSNLKKQDPFPPSSLRNKESLPPSTVEKPEVPPSSSLKQQGSSSLSFAKNQERNLSSALSRTDKAASATLTLRETNRPSTLRKREASVSSGRRAKEDPAGETWASNALRATMLQAGLEEQLRRSSVERRGSSVPLSDKRRSKPGKADAQPTPACCSVPWACHVEQGKENGPSFLEKVPKVDPNLPILESPSPPASKRKGPHCFIREYCKHPKVRADFCAEKQAVARAKIERNALKIAAGRARFLIEKDARARSGLPSLAHRSSKQKENLADSHESKRDKLTRELQELAREQLDINKEIESLKAAIRKS